MPFARESRKPLTTTESSSTAQSAGRRLSLITIDQAVAGGSNVLIAVLAARVLGVTSFGLFGLVFLVYVLAQGVSRALVCDPTLVHPLEAKQRLDEVIRTSCLLGAGLALPVIAGGLAVHVWSAPLGEALIVLGVCVPLLVLQDLGRYLGLAFRRPQDALVLDVTWLVLLVGGVGVLIASGTHDLAWFIAAWAGTGAIAGLLTLVQHRGHRPGFGTSWLRFMWPFSWRYLISYSSTQGAALLSSGAVGGIAGTRALAGVQGTLLLVRPYVTFQVAAVAAGVGEISHVRSDRERISRTVRRSSVLACSVAVLNTVVLLVLPDQVGRTILGDTWAATKPLLLPTGIQLVVLGITTGFRAGLLGQRAIRSVMAVDLVGTVVVVTTIIGGAFVNGAKGALWAVAAGHAVMMVIWMFTFFGTEDARRQHVGRHRADLRTIEPEPLAEPLTESLTERRRPSPSTVSG